MSATTPAFDGSLTEVLERYGDRNGTEAQCDKAQSLLSTAIALFRPEAHDRFFDESSIPQKSRTAEGLAADLEAYGDKEGMEAQMDEAQEYLTSALVLLTPSETEQFFANSEVATLLRDFGASQE